MNRKEAAEKVAKMRRLADDPRTPKAEADTARRHAERLSKEHGLGAAELASGRMAAAFDELVEAIEKILARHRDATAGLFGAESAIKEVIGQIRSWKDDDKATRLKQIVTVVRGASFFVGGHPLVAEAKAVVDATLKNHDVTI